MLTYVGFNHWCRTENFVIVITLVAVCIKPLHLNHYFNLHICPSLQRTSGVSHISFFITFNNLRKSTFFTFNNSVRWLNRPLLQLGCPGEAGIHSNFYFDLNVKYRLRVWWKNGRGFKHLFCIYYRLTIMNWMLVTMGLTHVVYKL